MTPGLQREAGNYPDLRLLRVGMEIVPFVEHFH
jgi:hypothetical protein